MCPVILLTCSGRRIDLEDSRSGRSAASCECKADVDGQSRWCLKSGYIRAVERAGGAPMLLPNAARDEHARAAVRACDGLLLTGGWDVSPARYGQQRHARVTTVDPIRDATELAAVDEAVRRGKPILGICRGIQVLNVALGGTLIQDIPSWQADGGGNDAGVRVNHGGQDHAIRIESGSLAASLWRDGLTVNSRHHQAVERIAPGLRATAWSPDGIIEAAQSSDSFPMLAVQCHPEDLWESRPEMLGPFLWLIRASRLGT
ncbi:MAG: gamma-glutamyl-gamma-aminobutyrate hydrolase family protein [Phycisphaerae bacterium]